LSLAPAFLYMGWYKMALQSTTALATVTLQAAAPSVTFSGIPQNYRDLVITFDGVAPGAGDLRATLNSDTATNYTFVQMSGDGSSTFATASTNAFMIFTFTAVAAQTVMTANILDYSATNKHKTCISRGNQVSGRVMAYATRWANTAAITSISINHAAGNLSAGTTISLYGRIA
jgi:hypothetical protein